jgi:long-chain acyl-CoA synthetase
VTDERARIVNVGRALREAALQWPTRVAVLDVGDGSEPAREHRFAELDERARSVVAELYGRGLAPGDRVALIAENSAELVAAWFGIVYAGCAVVPVPVLSAAPELAFRLAHASCRAVLFDPARSALVRTALAGLSPAPVPLELSSRALTAHVREPHDCAPGDAAMVLYTSGTTGKAKGAVISHHSLSTHSSVLARQVLGLHERDCVLGVLPLTHSYGCRMVMLASALVGARVVLVSRFSAARTLALMEEHAVTWLPAVPTMFAALGAEPPGPPLPALRWCLSAGAPLADETARRAEARLGVQVRQGYGMTEATFATVNAPPDERVLGSVGKAVPGVSLRTVDELGNDVAQGQDGEVLVRGHNVTNGYLDDPGATEGAFLDGYFRSGDVGRLDADGRLAIVDRIKDLIIRGGYNVYPSEVEDVLAAHPDVREVAVVGRPDSYYGEEVVAVIVARAGAAPAAAQLASYAAERLSKTKLPREYAFVQTLPLGPSGKVLKRTLRKWLDEAIIAPERVRGERP